MLVYKLHHHLVRFITEHSKPAYYKSIRVTRSPFPHRVPGEPEATPESTSEVLRLPVYNIPWILNLPGIFIPTSIIFWSLMGLLFQLGYNRWAKK